MKKLVLLLSALIFSQVSFAHDYTCTQGVAKRHISVEHEEGQELPCQVKYDKPDQATVEYPWNADSTPGYCEEEAEYLASRLGLLMERLSMWRLSSMVVEANAEQLVEVVEVEILRMATVERVEVELVDEQVVDE